MLSSTAEWPVAGARVPGSVTKFHTKRPSKRVSRRYEEGDELNPIELAREQFEMAIDAGCDLGFRWLKRLEEEEKRLLSS